MTAEGSIDYDALSQDAMRGVVRSVLVRTAKVGLPGEHHFYISFDTLAPGVVLSKRLREKYADEMTIVLQHRFWDLIVTDERFEVKLTFDGIPERLVVPFGAIRVFYDPSVRFGLQFEPGEVIAQTDDEVDHSPVRPSPLSAPPTLTAVPSSRASVPASHAGGSGQSARGGEERRAPSKPEEAEEPVAEAADAAAALDGAGSGAQVVSLDQFRKK